MPVAGMRFIKENSYSLKAAVGLAVGLAGSLLLARYLKSEVFQVPATDPISLIAVVLLLAVTAFLACLIPARRAARLGPMNALRQD